MPPQSASGARRAGSAGTARPQSPLVGGVTVLPQPPAEGSAGPSGRAADGSATADPQQVRQARTLHAPAQLWAWRPHVAVCTRTAKPPVCHPLPHVLQHSLTPLTSSTSHHSRAQPHAHALPDPPPLRPSSPTRSWRRPCPRSLSRATSAGRRPSRASRRRRRGASAPWETWRLWTPFLTSWCGMGQKLGLTDVC
jgi:hypothetical protein